MLAGAILAVVFVGCQTANAPARDSAEFGAEPVTQIDDLLESPAQYADQTLHVKATVERVLDRCVFSVAAESRELWPDPLLVMCSTVPPGAATPPESLQSGTEVRLTGKLVEFTREGFEQKSTVTMADEDFGNYDTRPVLIADEIEEVEQT